MVLKYSNDVSRTKPLEKHQYCVDSITTNQKKEQRKSMCSSNNNKKPLWFHCSERCGGAIYFACVSRLNTFFTLTMSSTVKNTPSLLGINFFYSFKSNFFRNVVPSVYVLYQNKTFEIVFEISLHFLLSSMFIVFVVVVVVHSIFYNNTL